MFLKKWMCPAVVVLLTTGCGSGAAPSQGGLGSSPTAPTQVAPAGGNVEVTRVRVFIKDGRPQAYIEGNLGDGCTRLLPLTQQRVGTTVHVTLSSVREGEVCTMIMQLVREWLPLQHIDAPGTYQVRANAVTVEFQLVASADGQLRVEPDPGPVPVEPTTLIPGRVVPDGPPADGNEPGQVEPAAPAGGLGGL